MKRRADRRWVFLAGTVLAFLKVSIRQDCQRKHRMVWFVGIKDVYVNELFRLSALAREQNLEVTNGVATILWAAANERNRRFPLRVGMPASTAVKWDY